MTSVRLLHAGIVLALIGVLLHAVVDFPLQVGSIQLYVAAMLGLGVLVAFGGDAPRQAYAIYTLLAIALAWPAGGALKERMARPASWPVLLYTMALIGFILLQQILKWRAMGGLIG